MVLLEETQVIRPYVYQVPCIDIVKKTLLTRDEVLYLMAMGLGKTITSAFIVEDRLRSGKRGLYLCHETYILKRVEKEYKKVIGNDISYKTFYGSEAEGSKDWTADQADMLFASFQSLNNWHNQWFLAFDRDHFDFMVVDESHHAQAPSYKEVIDYFQCKKIAMTATPDRMDLKDIREIFGEEVFNLPLEEGIANGWLANVEYHVLSDGINNAKLKKICKDVLEEGKRVSIKQINETIFIKERDKSQKDIIAEYSKIKEFAGNRKTLLFCERTIHADKLIPYFEKGGVMHSKKTWRENEAVFTAFEEGDLQYVASVNKFNEGKHVPGVEVIVFLRATDSLTVFWQQLGRALAKIGNKTKVIILDFVSNLERLIMIRDMMLRVQKIVGDPIEPPIKPPIDTNTFDVTGEGFEFLFSDELVDVMKIIDALRKGYYETWQEASKAAIALGIKTYTEYRKQYKKDLRLPWAPEIIYGIDFPGPGYDVFLGLEKEIFIPTLELALEELKKNRITDYWSLALCGSSKFYGLNFGRFGKATGLLNFVLEKSITYSFALVLELSDKLGWTPTEEEKIKRYKKELAKHKIFDHWTLLQKKAFYFRKLKFGKFGSAANFLTFVLEAKLIELNLSTTKIEILEKLSDKLGWTPTEEQKILRFKKEFAKQKITDYWSLNRIPLSQFANRMTWGKFGKAKGFIGAFFPELQNDRNLTVEVLDLVVDKLGWTPTEEEKIKRYKKEFAKHGIVDYVTLLAAPYPSKIRKADFGDFGKGFSFCSRILSKTADQLTSEQIINGLAEKFGWVPTAEGLRKIEEKKIVEYQQEFGKHGITDYWSLLKGSSRLNQKVSFGKFGKGNSFVASILEKTVRILNKEVLEEVAQKLRWGLTEEQKIERYKTELAKNGIRDYWTLIAVQQTGFSGMKFGSFGGGTAFFNLIMSKVLKNDTSLDELAVKLAWIPTEEQRVEKYRKALIEKGIKDYWDLLVIGIDDFRCLDFGFFGKGTAFCCRVLGRALYSISTPQRIEVAEKLGWIPTEEEKNNRYKKELAKNGIHTRFELDSLRTDYFTKMDFGIFGKGRPFVNYVLGNVIGAGSSISRQIMNNLADKIGLK